MTPTRVTGRRTRRGAILLVVITLLALFAVIGLSFVLYAESAATGSRIHREAQQLGPVNPDASSAANAFLGQLVYPNDPFANQDTYLLSGLTGHDLARLMYGHQLRDPNTPPGSPVPPANDIPYNGLGLVHMMLTMQTGITTPGSNTFTINRSEVINHSLFNPDPTLLADPTGPTFAMIVDPEYVNSSLAALPDEVVRTGKFRNGVRDFARAAILTNTTNIASPAPATFNYVGKNAPYTYADRNNAAVAAVDPIMGRVLAPSFYRPTLFGAMPTGSGLTLAPGVSDLEPPRPGFNPAAILMNPNWVIPSGRFKMVRPRRIDHLTTAEIKALQSNGALWPVPDNLNDPKVGQILAFLGDTPSPTPLNLPGGGQVFSVGKFPYPPRNPDGSITGDVQNLKFADGRQRMDSFWVDANLPTETIRGQKVAPLVAALVIPLDSRLNVSVAGNRKGGAAGGGTTGSNMGFGPTEQGIARLLTTATNADQIVFDRYGGTTNGANGATPRPPGVNQLVAPLSYQYFQPDVAAPGRGDRQTRPPAYAQIDWDGTGGLMAMPGGFSNLPTFPTYKNSTPPTAPNDATVDTASHPSLFNPYARPETASPANPHVFPSADLRWFAGRYSDKAGRVGGQTYLAGAGRPYNQTTPPEFTGSLPLSMSNLTNRARDLVTPLSNHLHRPALGVNFLDLGTANTALQYAPTTGLNTPFPSLSPPTMTLTTPPNVDRQLQGEANGYANTIRNLRAALGGVDLNRPLADYRDSSTRPPPPAMGPQTTPWPLHPATVTPASAAAAQADRQALARDIFIRLAVATGARVMYDPDLDVNNPNRNPAATPTPSYYAPYHLPKADTREFPNVRGIATYSASAEEYAALRWLAQLAANIVDYIDNDDVSTTFVWNPSVPAAGGRPDPLDPTNFTYDPANPTTPTNSPRNFRVVYGTEKPRLVLNEVYAELANDQNDRSGTDANNPFKVRFFVELLNPGRNETDLAQPLYGLTTQSMNNDGGSVALRYPNISSYQLLVYNNSAAVRDALDGTKAWNPTNMPPIYGGEHNVTGDIPVGSLPPKLKVAATDLMALNGTNTLADFVEPNEQNGTPNYTSNATGRFGFCVIGPQDNGMQGSDQIAFIPGTMDAIQGRMLYAQPATPPVAGQPGATMDYTEPAVKAADIGKYFTPNDPSYLNANKHAVVLQRLANPYLRVNDPTVTTPAFDPALPYNPYLTVDHFGGIEVQDAVRVGARDGLTPGTRTTDLPNKKNLYSVGRVQPYTGFTASSVTTLYQPYPPPAMPTIPQVFPQSFVVAQSATDAPTEHQISLFRHNGNTVAPVNVASPRPATLTSPATLFAPFEWMVHLDRKLVSPLELVHVSGFRPHELTARFGRPNGAVMGPNTPTFHAHDLQHQAVAREPQPAMGMGGTQEPPGPLFADGSPLFRALEVLTVKPWTHGLPTGGRVPGKVNPNALWDEDAQPPLGNGRSRMFDAVFNPQANRNGFDDTTTKAIWDGMKPIRSPGWQPNTVNPGGPVTTRDEVPQGPMPPQVDRPFRSFGAALLQNPSGTGIPNPTDRQDTLFRDVTPGASTTPNPLVRNAAAAHPYQQWEPLRKVINSTSTVSDTYLVLLTVGYFEVLEERQVDTGNGLLKTRVLGREKFDRTPGDLRTQFVSVVDRSALASQYAADPMNPNVPPAPWVQELLAPVDPPSTPRTSNTTPSGLVAIKIPAELYPENLGGSVPDYAYKPGATDADTTEPPILPSTTTDYRYVSFVPLANPNRVAVGGVYDGRRWEISAPSPTYGNGPGTQFWIGTGPNRQLVQAYYHPTQARWSYDPTTGTAKIYVQSADPLYQTTSPMGVTTWTFNRHEAGEAVTNAVFGSPGSQAGFDTRNPRFQAVVRYFGRITP